MQVCRCLSACYPPPPPPPVQVSKERVRVGEFMKDYDKLKSGRVSCINFARGLDLCGFGLTPDEVMVLENRYGCVAINV